MVMRISTNQHPIHQLRDEVDRLVTNVFANPAVAGAARLVSGRGFPAINVWDDRENFYVEAEVPGLKAELLDISVVGDELTIHGERPAEEKTELAYHRRERGVGSFTRVIRLANDIDAERVQASLTDGVLLLTLPKAEASKPRKIKVNTETSP
jgi:HSP20 family protein